MKRSCEICDSNEKEFLNKQIFLVPDTKYSCTKYCEYDVEVCKKCGFIFSDNIPSQEEYDIYYKNNSKYTYNANIPVGLQKIYSFYYKKISSVIKDYTKLNKENIKILDIGCSIGYLLNLFKNDGFKNLDGIEPSIECKEIAKKEYNLGIFNGVLNEFKSAFKYNLIMVFGVLEHITDLKGFILDVKKLMEKDCILIIAVPDVNKFSKKPVAPFDEFSIEHINFFTDTSLNNFMGKEGFELIVSKSINTEIYDSGSIMNFYKYCRHKSDFKLIDDKIGKKKINRYIKASYKRLKTFEKKIGAFIINRQKLIVWGVGSLTYRLLSSTNLKEANIIAFVDSNKNIQNKKIIGIEIKDPDILNENRQYPILIASNLYKNEIMKVLKEKYNISDNIITLD